MATLPQGASVQEALLKTVDTDPENFNLVFHRMRKMFPGEVTEACLCYLAQKGLDLAGRNMAIWLSLESRYIKPSFDANTLPLDVASKAIAALSKTDAQIFAKFLKAVEQIAVPQRMLRPLSLVPALGDYTPLLPWLRKLTQLNDDRVKSRAVKLLCGLKPHKSQVDRYMIEGSPRVRANILEALWNSNLPAAAELFRAALADPNHRVLINALIGLHLGGDPTAITRLIDVCQSPEPSFRTAAAWALGFIKDERGIPALEASCKDASVIVRKRALRSLLALQPQEAAAE